MKYIIFFLTIFTIITPLNNIYAECVFQGEDEASMTAYKQCLQSSKTQKNVTLDSPLGEAGKNPQILIGTVINGIMGIVGSLALLMFVYGGLTWMTAAGGSEKVQKGKDIIMWATLGLIVIFASYGLVKFVLDVLAGNAIT